MYIAYYVTLLGAAQASYELRAKDDEAAKVESRQFLKLHPSIEVWEGAKWVARFTRRGNPAKRAVTSFHCKDSSSPGKKFALYPAAVRLPYMKQESLVPINGRTVISRRALCA